MKQRAIDLQLIKPVMGKTNLKGKITLRQLQKELLSDLNVPFADMCCDNPGDQTPLGAPVRFINNDLQYFDITTGTWLDATPAIAASRFGVATEDDTAAENRLFTLDGFDFIFQSESGDGVYVEFQASTVNKNIYFQATDVAVPTNYAYISTTSNATNSDIDLYLQRNGGVQWGELYLTQNSLYLAHSDEVDIENGDGDILLRLITGTGIYIEVDDGNGHTIEIQGVPQDDTATKVMTLNASNEVVWVDKATIGATPGSAVVFVDHDSVNVANDGSPNTGWSVPVEAGKSYTIEAYLLPIHSSGVGYNMTFVLPGSALAVRAMYEFNSPASGGEIDTLNIKRENQLTLGTFNMPNTAFNSPAGSPATKVIGYIDTNDTNGNLQLTVSLDGPGPQTGNVSGWIKLTEVPA